MKRGLHYEIAALLLAGFYLSTGAAAQEWAPSKLIELTVPVPPGSSTDILARMLAERLPKTLGQPVMVINRPGASGLIGAAAVARSEADGHTLLLPPSTLFGAPHVMPKGSAAGVDVVGDLAPIVITATSPLLILAHPRLGVKTAPELVEHLKRNPGLPFASSGNGSPQHIGGELFQRATGTQMTHVPYKGVMPAITDTVAGQITLAFSALGGVGQYIESGQVLALAVAEKARTPLLPDVPTLTESGIEGVELNIFFPVLAPRGTPQAAIDRLNREIDAIVRDPEVTRRMRDLGVATAGSTVEEAQRRVRDEFDFYGKVVADFGLGG